MKPDRCVPRGWLPEWLSQNPYQDDELPGDLGTADTIPAPPPSVQQNRRGERWIPPCDCGEFFCSNPSGRWE